MSHWKRRDLLLAWCVGSVGCASQRSISGLEGQVRHLEMRLGGRIGVSLLRFDGKAVFGYRCSERFALASTFKWLLAAVVLNEVEAGELRLDQRIPFTEADMVAYAPITGASLGEGFLTVVELCRAAVQFSDNPAANLLLGLIDGPSGFTERLRKLGDETTRLDRWEPELNSNEPADSRDTTAPCAMSATLHRIWSTDILSRDSRAMLAEWMSASRTGVRRLRAGWPRAWQVADKTGTGGNGAVNAIAVVRVPAGQSFFVAAYFSESVLSREALEHGHAELATMLVPLIRQ